MSEPSAPDLDQDQPDDQPAPEAPASDQAPEADLSDIAFDDTFDPAQLPDELRPAYKQMQGAFTKKTQTLAEERQEIAQHKQLIEFLSSDDPDEKALALHALGYDLDPGDPDYEDDLEDAEDHEIASLKQQLAELNEWRDSQQQTAEQSAYEDAVNEFLDESWDELKKQTGRGEFTDKEELLLEQVAAANLDDDGLPDLQAAYELVYGEVLPHAKKQWLGKKTAQPAPGDGSAGTPQVDLSDEDQRRAFMARALEEAAD